MASDRTRTCIHPSVSRLPPDLYLFFNPTFGSSRHCFSSCQIMCITHSPVVGRLFHLPIRSYGREDRTRTCDPWFGLYIRFELMILPLLYRLTNFSAYWLTVTKTSVLTNWTTSRNVWFSIILRITTNPENSFRLLPRLTFTEGLHWSVHNHYGIAIAS